MAIQGSNAFQLVLQEDKSSILLSKLWLVSEGRHVESCRGTLILSFITRGPLQLGCRVVRGAPCHEILCVRVCETGALMFALEHRYYGCHNISACPVKDFKNATAALQFLSSRQAVEDVAHFVTEMKSMCLSLRTLHAPHKFTRPKKKNTPNEHKYSLLSLLSTETLIAGEVLRIICSVFGKWPKVGDS
eukprot:2390800-Amphidinium_carterae.1